MSKSNTKTESNPKGKSAMQQMMKISTEQLRQYFPEQFEHRMGGNIKVLPTKATSVEAYYQHWISQHKNDFIEVEAWDDSCNNVPSGSVLVRAALGGDEERMVAYWMVKAEHYYSERTEFGYVINPSGDEPRRLKD